MVCLFIHSGPGIELKCLFHNEATSEANLTNSKTLRGQNSQDSQAANVIAFKEMTWSMVMKAAAVRKGKTNFSSSKYYGIINNLPNEPNASDGYHPKCYSNFTAVAKTSVDKTQQSDNLNSQCLRSETPPATENSKGIFKNVCLFCNSERRRSKSGILENLGSCETIQAENSIKEAAIIQGDSIMQAKISGIDMIAKEVKYHHSCRSNYLRMASRKSGVKKDNDNATGSSFKDICFYIEKYIINEQRPELLTSIYTQYCMLCDDSNDIPYSTAQTFLRAVLENFKGKIKASTQSSRKSGTILYSSEVADEAIRTAYDFASSPEYTVIQAAMFLRKAIKDVALTKFSNCITVEDLAKGEAKPPDLLMTFFQVLHGGPSFKTHNEKVMRTANSASQDALFNVFKGNVKPAKQTLLGLAVKSMTGSKKLLTLLNRFGHTLNYHCIEELETSLASTIINRKESCPDGAKKNLIMGVAFDNYDELCNTLSGSDTLHDTMGILYQEIGDSQPIGEHSRSITTNSSKRKLQLDDLPLTPY